MTKTEQIIDLLNDITDAEIYLGITMVQQKDGSVRFRISDSTEYMATELFGLLELCKQGIVRNML